MKTIRELELEVEIKIAQMKLEDEKDPQYYFDGIYDKDLKELSELKKRVAYAIESEEMAQRYELEWMNENS